MNMNRIASSISFGLALGVLAAPAPSAAETVTTSKTTTYSGTVAEVNPSSSTIILKSESSPAPVTYTYSKETTFVDAQGNVVTYETIKNSPVTVEYTTEGGVTVVRKVIQTAPAAVVVPPAAPAMREKTTTHTETETR
ncbi:MAG: hypothetical protein ABR538_07065 [Candidatus Binatia bacterium]